MNLGKLLAAGKSMAWRWTDQSRYRVDKRVYLPKFGSPKCPFTPGDQTAASPKSPDCLAASVQDKAPAKTQTLASASPAPDTPPLLIANPSAAGLGPRGASRWLSKLNPFAVRPARPVALLKNSKSPIQPELSLDAVKVLRNDLSDADVEIVPLKSRPSRPASAATASDKESWALLGERLVNAETP